VIWLFDGVLVGLILVLAWRCLQTEDLFQAVVLFMALGLLIALAWTRLHAADAALAEAAIGSGLAGALLLSTLSRLNAESALPVSHQTWLVWPWRLVWLGLAGGLALALSTLPLTEDGLAALSYQALPDSGVAHPVTAVLLNFRAWDTALELAVLLWAWLVQRSLAEEPSVPLYPLQGAVLTVGVRALMPLMVLVAAYLLWRGSFAPGGAFQSGAVLAAALVLWWLAYGHYPSWHSEAWVKLSWVVGFWVFMLIGLLGAALGFGFMGYAPAQAGGLILLIEIVATVSIASALAWMFSGRVPLHGVRP
jgi:multisubunit Na+/H+ antiporter MnhB subunit